MSYKLEVIAFNIESCRVIEQQGAHRIELCDNPQEGGTTPSFGFIKKARKAVSIDLFPIIRPRGGDFLYSEDEYEIMREDIRICKELGCNGVVIGILQINGRIDTERTKRLVDLAYPMEVTFHRAFDRVAEPVQALEDVISCGCTRILTSGLHPAAAEGRLVLQQLVQQADNRIIIMPGSGLRSSNIADIVTFTGAEEFHTSARILRSSNMMFCSETMKENLTHATADEKEVADILVSLRSLSMK